MRKFISLLILVSCPALASDPTGLIYFPVIIITGMTIVGTSLTMFIKHKKVAFGCSLLFSFPALCIAVLILLTNLRNDEIFDLPLIVSLLSFIPLIVNIGRNLSDYDSNTIDIDGLNIGEFRLGYLIVGNEYNVDIERNYIIERRGYSANVINNEIVHIQINFSQFFSHGLVFDSVIRRNNKLFSDCKNITPAAIKNWFGEPIREFDDGVELNFQFKDNDILVEFSWHHHENILIANYISFEIDQN